MLRRNGLEVLFYGVGVQFYKIELNLRAFFDIRLVFFL
jgi:hypothetical protein